METQISVFQSDLSRKLHGTSLAKVEGVLPLLAEAARNVLFNLDPFESIRIADLDSSPTEVGSAEYYVYDLPDDLKGDKIISIRHKDGKERARDLNTRSYEFNAGLRDNRWSIEYKDGKKQLRSTENMSDKEVEYYSNSLFKDSSNNRITRPTSANNVIIADIELYNILLYETLKEAAFQIQGEDAQFAIQKAEAQLNGRGRTPGLYDKYAKSYKTAAQAPNVNYYYESTQ